MEIAPGYTRRIIVSKCHLLNQLLDCIWMYLKIMKALKGKLAMEFLIKEAKVKKSWRNGAKHSLGFSLSLVETLNSAIT